MGKSSSDFELVVFDMDGVLVDITSSWYWVHSHFGVSNEESLELYFKGKIDDEEFIRRDIQLWKNLDREVKKTDLVKILRDAPLMSGLDDCLSQLDKRGLKCAVISGGLKPLAEHIDKGYFDRIMANDVEGAADNTLTGNPLVEVRLDGKGDVFENILEELKVHPSKCVAVGDTHIDIPMLEKAGLGIAFRPKDKEIEEVSDVTIEEKDLARVLDHIF